MIESQATGGRVEGERFQFRLWHLFLFTLVMAAATRYILSPEWTVVERWLLASWFIGWVSGIVFGVVRGKRLILAASVGGVLGGFTAALVLYLGFFHLVRSRTFPLRHDVALPLASLFVLALVSSALLAAGVYLLLIVARKLKRPARQDSARPGVIRNWMVKAMAVLAAAAILAWWCSAFYTWEPVATLDIRHAYDGSGPAVAFSPDGKLLAVGSSKGFIEFWELPALKLVARYDVDLAQGVWNVEFSDDGSMLAYASIFDPRVRVIDVATGEQRVEVDTKSQGVKAFAQSNDTLTVIAVPSFKTSQMETTLWNAATGEQTGSFRMAGPGLGPVAHPGCGLLAYLRYPDKRAPAGYTISIHRLDDGRHIADGPELRQFTSHFWPCFSHDGDWICMKDLVWNHQTGESYQIPGDGMGFLPNHRLIAMQTGAAQPLIVMLPDPSTDWLHHTPFLWRAVSLQQWNRVLVYDVESRRVLRTGPKLGNYTFAWISPDGKRIATLGGKAELQIWNLPDS